MRILAILVLSVLSLSVFAETDTDISKVPFEKCDWGQIFVMAHFKTVSQSADTSKEVIRLSTELKNISSKAPDQNKPVDEQISKSDLVKLNEVIQRINTINASSRLEGWRGRDLEMIYGLWQIVQNNYKNVKPLSDKDPNYLYQATVGSFSILFPDYETHKPDMPQQAPICSVDTSLLRLENEANTKINRTSSIQGAQHKLDLLNDMAARYHVQSLDDAKLSPKDRKTFNDIINNFVKPMTHENEYIQNIETLRAIEAASELIYETGKADLLNSGGDSSKVGTIIAEKVSANEINPRTKSGIGFIRLLAKKLKPENEAQDIPLQGK